MYLFCCFVFCPSQIDFVPRVINDLQKQALKLLARQVMSACESRLRIIHLEEALLQLEETRGALKASKEQAERAQKQAEQANLTKSEFLAKSVHRNVQHSRVTLLSRSLLVHFLTLVSLLSCSQHVA